MAKRRYNRKYSGGGMGFFGKVMIAILFLSVVGGAILSWVYWEDVKTFFNDTGKRIEDKFDKDEELDVEQDENEASENVDINLNEANGIALAMETINKEDFSAWAIPENAESAFKINMDVLPSYATNKKLVWAMDFSPQTELEQDRLNEIISLGYTLDVFASLIVAEDTHSAILVVNMPFGVHININAYAESTPDVNVSVGVDYALRWTGAKMKYYNNGDNFTLYQIDSTPKYITIDSSWVDSYKGIVEFVQESTTATIAYGYNLQYEVHITKEFRDFCSNYFNLPMSTANLNNYALRFLQSGEEYSFTYFGLYGIDLEKAGLDESTTIDQLIDLYGNTFRGAVNAWTEQYPNAPVYNLRAFGADGVNASHLSNFTMSFSYASNTFTVDVENIVPDSGDIVA